MRRRLPSWRLFFGSAGGAEAKPLREPGGGIIEGVRIPYRRLLVLLWLSLWSQGCSQGDSAEMPVRTEFERPPVLVIGVDGLEWSVLQKVLNQGRAPHMQSLIERGMGGRLATQLPTFSPVLWTTVATGVGHVDHGIHHFAVADVRHNMKPGALPYTSNARKVPAIWNIADENDREVLAVAWWVSWPAEKLKHPYGRIVASYTGQAQAMQMWKPGVHQNGLPQLTFPESLQEKILPQLAKGGPKGVYRDEYNRLFGEMPDNSDWDFPRTLDALFRTSYHGDRTHLEITLQELRRRVPDLTMVYLGLPDVAGHYFWRYYEPGKFNYPILPSHRKMLGPWVEKSYEVVDQWIGRLLEAVPDDARILIISDHGMLAANPDDPTSRQSGGHENAPPGVMILAGPGVARGGLLIEDPRALIGTVLGIFPTLLDWLGLEVPTVRPYRKSLRRLMTPEWQEQNPLRTRNKSYNEGFRPATPPIKPPGDAAETFHEAIFDQLGYGGGEDDED